MNGKTGTTEAIIKKPLVLDLASLIADYQSGKIELSFPAHYKKKLSGPEAKLERIDEEIFCFCRHYLDERWPSKSIAKTYGVTTEEVNAVRDQWSGILSRYFSL